MPKAVNEGLLDSWNVQIHRTYLSAESNRIAMDRCAHLEANQMNASAAKTTATAANAEPTDEEAPI